MMMGQTKQVCKHQNINSKNCKNFFFYSRLEPFVRRRKKRKKKKEKKGFLKHP